MTAAEDESEVTSIACTNLFQHEDILYHLFSVLSLEDLLNCRLVSKQWARLGLPFVNDLSVIHINYPQRLAEFLQLLEGSESGSELGKGFFLSSIYMDHPVTSLFFSLYGSSIRALKLCIQDEHQMSVESLEHLLLNQAPYLESLEISLPGGMENQPRLFSKGSEAEGAVVVTLPCLKSLRLCNNHGYHPGFLEDLFHAAPNLVHFKALLDNSINKEASVILEVLERTGAYLRLRKLELESIVTESHFRSLIELSGKGMRLRSLAFTQLHPRYFDKYSLQCFLLSQRASLEYLRVDSVPSQYYWEDEVSLTLSQMGALKGMTVSGHEVPLPVCHLALYDFVPQAMAKMNSIDAKLRRMKKKCR